MKRTTKLVLGLVAVLVVLGLFLLPVVPVGVGYSCNPQQDSVCPLGSSDVYAHASVMYAYFGLGAVQMPVGGQPYCFMYGNPGTMCGQPMERMG